MKKKNVNVERKHHLSLLLSYKEVQILDKVADGWSRNEIIRFLIHFYADVMGYIEKDELFKNLEIKDITSEIGKDGKKEKGTVQMWVRFSPTEQKLIKSIAKNIGMNTSDFIRYAIRYYILTKYIGKDCIDLDDAINKIFKKEKEVSV